MSTQSIEKEQEYSYAHDKSIKETAKEALRLAPHEKKSFVATGILFAGIILGSLTVGITAFFFGTTVGWIAGGVVMAAAVSVFLFMALDVVEDYRNAWKASVGYVHPDRIQSRMAQMGETKEEATAHFKSIHDADAAFRAERKNARAKLKVEQAAQRKVALKELKKQRGASNALLSEKEHNQRVPV